MDGRGVDIRQMKGRRGEDIALEYLLQQGMVLLERNWRCGHKELDLVMLDGNFIRVVEVRSRTWPSGTDPLESVDEAKRRKIISAARGFCATVARERGVLEGREVVFDVVSILFNGDLFKVEYVKEAFAPSW